ncbi:hypothetical protein [Blastococcus saxobsidens]|uniref:Uncharacterized protein n=1 Tax=Blastococcus saxobsidens (strain DD2) TaxID=1146883 RepID=H6RP32_BLASD|nr:hypothetical protein [Blastococcus saxobsidens]CCG02693.1 protein of unknown function [Blastococcus saxobsidens DD2]
MTAAAGRILSHLDEAQSTENALGDWETAPLAGPVPPPEGARVLATA